MAQPSSFQRSSPLRTPVRLSKLKQQHKLQKCTDVPPLATHLLRSLNNDRRNSLTARITIGRTVRQDGALLDQSCMDQFDDSYALASDARQPLTPRKSPHLRRRDELTHFNKILKFTASPSCALERVSRKKITSMRKRMMNTMRKVLPLADRRQGYSKL